MTMGGSTGMTREEAIERLAESYYDIGALGARWENESDDARLPFREDARRIFDALGLTVAPPLCEHCKMRPATCFGRYDDMEVGAYACDVCCGHGCEDGRCTTVAPPPGEDAKDAEIARLRGENEKMRGVRVALADLQVSVEVRDQLAAIEREVREAHAEEIASLRAEVARLRQPPPSPSREEAVERLTNMLLHAFAHGARAFGHPVAVAENEGRAMRGGVSPETLEGITDRADTILRTLGLTVAPPPSEEKDAEIARLRAQKDGAYSERDQCVALIARMAVALGYRAGLGRHVGGEWDDDWRNIVFIDLPAGQVSWHIHDSELPLFDFLGQYEAPWDGHSTAEKYERCMGALRQPPPSEEKDAEIARLRAEIDAARAEFFACAEAIGIVYETDGHASAPGPVETVVDFIREARRRSLEHVDCEMRRSAVDTYTVEVPAALVERALNPEHYDGEKLCPTCRERMPEAGEPFGHDTNECARKALLDAVLSQLGAKP